MPSFSNTRALHAPLADSIGGGRARADRNEGDSICPCVGSDASSPRSRRPSRQPLPNSPKHLIFLQ
jgi:hypothetical protein